MRLHIDIVKERANGRVLGNVVVKRLHYGVYIFARAQVGLCFGRVAHGNPVEVLQGQ